LGLAGVPIEKGRAIRLPLGATAAEILGKAVESKP
jgi:hypothetical protein